MNLFLRLCGLVTLALVLPGCLSFESPDDQVKRLSELYSINITTAPPPALSLENDTAPNTQQPLLEFFPASFEEAEETLDGIEEALSIYPLGFIASMIDSIFITGQILIEGAEAGATFGPKWIAISNTPEWNGTKANFENGRYAVHHELSSLVLSKKPMFRMNWRSLMPTDWVPASSETEALNTPMGEPSYGQGFLSEYAKTSVGNDFNVYAEYVFGNPAQLIRLADTHKAIAKKVGLFLSIYAGTDSRFEDYFVKTGLDRLKQPLVQTEMQIKFDLSGVTPTKVESEDHN